MPTEYAHHLIWFRHRRDFACLRLSGHHFLGYRRYDLLRLARRLHDHRRRGHDLVLTI